MIIGAAILNANAPVYVGGRQMSDGDGFRVVVQFLVWR
jgi:hypothetical protein